MKTQKTFQNMEKSAIQKSRRYQKSLKNLRNGEVEDISKYGETCYTEKQKTSEIFEKPA